MRHRIFIISLVLLGLVQLSFGQKAASPAKQKLVSQLVQSTAQIFPFEQFEDGFQKASQIITADFEKDITEQVRQKIESMGDLSEPEKAGLKSRAPEVAQAFRKLIDNWMMKDFQMKKWVNESANNHFKQKFSVVELQKLNSFLKSSGGRLTLSAMRNVISHEFKETSTKTNSVEAEKFEKIAEEFSKTRLGAKFLQIVIEDIFTDVQKNIDRWEAIVFGNIDSPATEKEFDRLLNEFFKKGKES
jgi:hypothetical protein